MIPTVALVVFTGILGAVLARQQGLATMARFQASLEAGRLPGRELIEGILILVAAAVLLTPGLLTDAAGFLLLVPVTRQQLAQRIARAIESRLTGGIVDSDRDPTQTDQPGVIDVPFEVEQDPERKDD